MNNNQIPDRKPLNQLDIALLAEICQIVEHKQQESIRAEYGKQQLQHLSQAFTAEFGRGFDARNLRNMLAFYLAFPNWNAVRSEFCCWKEQNYLQNRLIYLYCLVTQPPRLWGLCSTQNLGGFFVPENQGLAS